MSTFYPKPLREPTHIFATCPWCKSPRACLENPDYPRSGEFLQGICRSCSGLFQIDKHPKTEK